MSLINLRERTINAKVVYYGTALSGKTTSLKHIHRVVDPDSRIELVSLNTEGDRTLFFDFLPIPLGTINGFQVKLQAFTVPGQVKYNLTRRYVLRGADAVIFVADSGEGAMGGNEQSLSSLYENLEANGLDRRKIPYVFQYNKRDLPSAVSLEDLRFALNAGGVPDFETTATNGRGVFEAFSSAASLMIVRLAQEYRIGDPERIRHQLEERLGSFREAYQRHLRETDSQQVTQELFGDEMSLVTRTLADTHAVRSDESASVIHIPTVPDESEMADVEDLLEQAVETQMQSAQLVTELAEMRRRLGDHVRHLVALCDTGVVISSELDGDRLLTRVLESALRTVDASHGSVLLLSDEGTCLREKLVQGFSVDPVARGGATEPGVLERVLARRPFVIIAGEPGLPARTAGARDSQPMAALVAPLVHQREVLGALVAYLMEAPREADGQLRLRFLAAVAAQAAVAIENSRLYARVEAFNRELERKVAERTRELERAYSELMVLDGLKDDFLHSMSHELLTPLTSINSFAEILVSVAGDEGPAAQAERKEFAMIVHRESTRLTEMLQTVLDLSRLEAGKVAMALGEVDLREALLHSYKRVRGQFKARNIRVTVRADHELPRVRADARWLARVIDALLSNAAKFSPPDAAVEVRMGLKDDEAMVEVEDAGPGVSPQLRGQVFQKFKQLGDVLTDKTPGLGLGLHMANVILERFGGRIWHEPAEPKGSIFGFALQLVPPAAGIDADETPAHPPLERL